MGGFWVYNIVVMKEFWKDIPGYEGRYQTSTRGRVKGLPCCSRGTETILKPNLKKSGYFNIQLCQNGQAKTWRLHRLIAITFLANPEGKPQVNHKDGNRQNNCVKNLEWVTPSENILHSFRALGRKSNGGVMRKPIVCMETGITYHSIREAERETKILRSSLRSALKFGWKAGGYHWTYI